MQYYRKNAMGMHQMQINKESTSLFHNSMTSIILSLNLEDDTLCAVQVFKTCYSYFLKYLQKKDDLSSFVIENNVDIVLGLDGMKRGLGFLLNLTPVNNLRLASPPCQYVNVTYEPLK